MGTPMRWAPTLALLASSLVACGQSIVASDAAPVQPDAADVADAPAPLDVVDAPAAPDATDVTDASDATDVTDVTDATDVAPPPVEVCNGIDDNRDGMVDNLTPTACMVGPCSAGMTACRAGITAGSLEPPTCVGGVPAPATTVCRPSAGPCDRAENCTGTSDACPADAVAAGGTVCRAAVGVCDRAETCSGATAVCPSDVFTPAGTACGTSGAVCDAAGNCGGCSAGQSLCGGQCMVVTGACMAGVGACARSGTLSCASGGAPEVTHGVRNTYARLRDGTVRAWGQNSYGQLGNGTTMPAFMAITDAVAVAGLTGVTQISAGQYHVCALLTDGTVRCWGLNSNGQVGFGSADTSRTTPVAVTSLTDVTAVRCGGNTSCALRRDRTVWCWGSNSSGQLGDGTMTNRTTPVQVMGVTDAVALSVGSSHACVVRPDRTVQCWGANTRGQLGDGTTTNRATPVAAAGLTDVAQVAAGGSHTCALITGGAVRCWGDNASGQLGEGTVIARTGFIAAMGISDATQLMAAAGHSCVILPDRTMRCWGRNNIGQLGDGGAALTLARPAAVVGITTATRVSAFDETTCAILDDDTVRCWGTNGTGELGIGTTNTLRNPPTRVTVITASVCSATPGTPGTETCNRVDDDCDGMVDEGCT